MATKRMFSREITDSDSFLDLSLSAQALYFHLGMGADDEGMISSAKRTARSIGASDDAITELVQAGFLIAFPGSGVYAIKHFFVNNLIRTDRAKETIHKAEVAQLQKGENGVYSVRLPDDGQFSADCPANVRQMSADCPTNANQEGKQPRPDDGIDQVNQRIGIVDQVNQVKTRLAAEGWTMTDIDKAIERCRGKEVKKDLLSYLRRTLENMKKEHPVTIPTVAQDFQQRSYEGVDAEMISDLAEQMKRFKATGEVS